MKNPRSTIEILGKLAHGSLVKRLIPGPGFRVMRNGKPLEWTRARIRKNGKNRWVIEQASSNLSAIVTLDLDPGRHAVVWRVLLRNWGKNPLTGITEVSSIYLRVGGLKTAPRIVSSAGGTQANEYPPLTSFRTRTSLLPFPYPSWRVRFSTPENESRSSQKDLPIIMVSPDIEQDAPGFLFGLEWSSCWDAQLNHIPFTEELMVSAGAQVENLTLDPGESLELPAVHLVFFDGGFENGSNACRGYIRDCLSPRYLGKPVVPPAAYTIWPGIVAPYTEKDIHPQIDTASELGLEIFMVDDAWYPGDFPRGRGNWYPDPVKFPDGLEPVAEHVKAKGMGFGLFFEPEMAEPGSWILRKYKKYFYPSRDAGGRAIFNFSDPEACAFMTKFMGGFIQRYDLRFIRWDNNINLLPFIRAIDPSLKLNFAHMRGLYGVWESLLAKYPKLMLECCSSGGNRMDFGTLKRHHSCWCNDNMGNPYIYAIMQSGGNFFLPANYFGSLVSWPFAQGTPGKPGVKKHLDARLPDLSFLGRMAGVLFLGGRIADWSPAIKKRAKHWISIYKKIRHLLVRDYYRVLPQPQSEEDWIGMQFCDGAKEGVVFVFRWAGSTERQNLKLRALSPGKTYLFRDETSGHETRYSGETLIRRGLSVGLKSASAKLFTYKIAR